MKGQDGSRRDLRDVLDKNAGSMPHERNSPPAAYLGIGVIEVVLRVGKVEVLLEHHIVFLPASANHDCFDIQRALSLDRDVDVRFTDTGRCLRHCIWLDIVACNLASRRLPGRICDDLEQPRNVPVLVQRMVRLRGGHVKCDIVRKAISKGGGKWCQVQKVGRKVKSAVRSDGSRRYGQWMNRFSDANSHLQTEGLIPPVKMTA